MKQRVYIETTIVSYLTAKPSANLIMLANQKLTREWWAHHRGNYDLYTSQLVLDEAADGDPLAARKRLDMLADIPQVPFSEEAAEIADELVKHGLLPRQAATDATHLAIATLRELDVLLTWNCRHLANASLLVRIGRLLRMMGYEIPVVCTPYEMMADPGESRE